MPELLFTQHMNARVIYLGYEAARKGWENVQELALAEMAAFSGGGGFSGKGAPQAKYRAFFKKHPDLFEGWTPTAPAAVLYAHFGPNPFGAQRPHTGRTIHSYLAKTHRLFVALIDKTLPERAEDLAQFRVIYLQSPAYEMSEAQLAALRACRASVVLQDATIAINGEPATKQLGPKAVLWDWAKLPAPVDPKGSVAPSDGLRRSLRLALYRKGGRLALHAVNYNVCLLDKGKRVLDVGPTPVRVPLPEGWRAVRATGYDPDAEPEVVPCTVADGTASLAVPKTHIYRIVLIEKR